MKCQKNRMIKMYDLVVTYLDSTKKDWQKEYIKYKKQEINDKVQSEDNRQAFGMERYRDWETLKYFLRGVETNCKWVRNVIIVMQNKNQIPNWLNVNNNKLKIVFHEDYMPKEILPTFGAMPIGLYVSNIKDLSDFYVMSDDDFYFLNEIPVEMFFRDGKTVQMNNEVKYEPFGERFTKASDGVFYEILNNNLKIETKYMGEEKRKYLMSHLPEARDKKLEQQIIKDNEKIFLESFIQSRFRSKNQYCAQIFPNVLKIQKKCIFDNTMATQCAYATLTSTLNFGDYKDYKIVCFNDTEQLDDFKLTKERLITFLESKLPNKSSYEK